MKIQTWGLRSAFPSAPFSLHTYILLDCEHALISSKIRGEKRKTSERAGDSPALLAARGFECDARMLTTTNLGCLLSVLPHGFASKRETARGLVFCFALISDISVMRALLR